MFARFLPQNPLFRLLLVNGLIGTAVAILLVVGLIVTDAHQMGTLIANAENPALPIIVLTLGLVITFGSVAMGMAVMMLPYPDEDDDEQGGSGGPRQKVIRPDMRANAEDARSSLRPITVPATRPGQGRRRGA